MSPDPAALPGGEPQIRPVADRALLVSLDPRIDPAISDRILGLKRALEEQAPGGLEEVVCSYQTLLAYYDPLTLSFNELKDIVENCADSKTRVRSTPRRWSVPVRYGGRAAPDLEALAQRHGLTADEVIDIHSSTVHRVYLVGFSPGWTFLGGVDERLHTPRLPSPRAVVPAGCISIGGQQGMIGGLAMPSGWNLIGQTPERTYAPERDDPFFLEPGDEVVFRPIGKREFASLAKAAADGGRISEPVSPRPGPT
jgi:KipI family sensor histidine kinase inhibitor